MILVLGGTLLTVSMKKLEKITLCIYLSVILIIYPLFNIIYKNNPLIQNANRLMLVFVTMLVLLFFLKKTIGKGLRNIDILIIFVALYITTSLLLYFSYNKLSTPDLLREILYSILPFIVYFASISIGNKHKDFVINLIMVHLFIVAIIGFIVYFNIHPILFKNVINILKRENVFFWQFGSIYGVIIMGYLSQLMYALILFDKYKGKHKKFLLVIFLIISILTLQRSAVIGIIMSTLVFTVTSIVFSNIKAVKETVKLILIFFLVLVVLLNVIDRLEILDYNLSNQIISKVKDIRITSVVEDRNSQAIIFNDNNFFNILFGEGFGKYSPNNSAAVVVQPDASYYRIYNELGLIGFILFFSIFIYFFLKGLKKKDYFMLYFISFTLIAFYFNRVMWAIPNNYIIFMLLGLSESNRVEKIG